MKNLKIAIVGAGVMGTGVACDLASYGYSVVLKDIDKIILDESVDNIKKDLKFYKMIKKEFKELTIGEILNKINFTLNSDEIKDADLIIENITEDWDKKKELYSELNKMCKANVVFAVNTSCISITQIAALVDNSQNVIGVHFMNPVPLKEIVETIKGYHTSEETIEFMKSFLKSINKTAVIVNDFPGFVANRLSHLFMNEAAFLVQDGVASPAQIDMIFKKGYGHKMGPLETADLIGLDTVVDSLEILYKSYQDSKFRCCPLLRKMVNAGLLGRKTGKGFYDYKG